MPDFDWSIFQSELTTDSCENAASALAHLDIWWMNRKALAVKSELENSLYWNEVSEIPLGIGACWMLITNSDAKTYSLLKPAFLLPLKWSKEATHDSRLPQALHDLADDVLHVFQANDRTLHLHLNLASPETPDLTTLKVNKEDIPSGWTSLACGLVSALEAKSPLPHVWSTGAWTPEVGVSTVGGFEKKLKLCHEYKTERQKTNDSLVLFVPRSNFDEAYDIKRKNHYTMEIIPFPESVPNPNETLADYFSWHKIRQKDYRSLSLKPNLPPTNNSFAVKGLGYYTEADRAHFIGREKNIDEILNAVLDQPITALTGDSGVGKSSLLHAGLCPAIRKQNYQVAYIRTDRSPSTSIPEKLSKELLVKGKNFSLPLDYARLRAELLAMRCKEQSSGLLLILDQFEAVVSESSHETELSEIRRFLHDAQQEARGNWPIRIVCSYRYGANPRIQQLLSEIVDADDNSPGTIFLYGLERADAIKLLDNARNVLPHCDQIDTITVVGSLVEQSAALRLADQVYPPFLQILMAELQSGRNPVAFLESPCERIGTMIGNYLRTTLSDIESQGNDPIYTHIMQTLCLANGRKSPQTFQQLHTETHAGDAALREAVEVLQRHRLVTVCGEQVEIIHDQLALAVRDTLGLEDIEAKRSKELLEARMAKYSKILELCSEPALVDLFRYRTSINTNDNHQRYLFACRIAISSVGLDQRPSLPIGWYWTRDIHDDEESLLAILRDLSGDPHADVRSAAVAQLGQFANLTDLPRIIEVAQRDPDYSVQVAAIRSLAEFESIHVHDELYSVASAGHRHSTVRLAAVASLSALEDHECMEHLQALTTGYDEAVSNVALAGIAKIISDEELPWLRGLLDNEYARLRKSAVEQIAGFEQPEDRYEFQRLCKDANAEVAAAAIESLAIFDHVDDVPLLRELCESTDGAIARAAEAAISSFGNPAASRQFREYLSDSKATVQTSAIKALANIGLQDDLDALSRFMDDSDRSVKLNAVSALKTSMNRSDLDRLLAALRDCPWDENSPRYDQELADTILVTLNHRVAQFAVDESHEFLSDASPWIRSLGISVVAQKAGEPAIQQCLKMVDDLAPIVRIASAQLLLRMCETDFPFNELIYDSSPAVRLIAIQSASRTTVKPTQTAILLDLARTDKDETVRLAAIDVLLAYETLDTLTLLGDLAESDPDDTNRQDNPVVHAATQGISFWRSSDAINSLTRMTGSLSANCRTAAASALCAVADREVLESLLAERNFQLEPDVLAVLDEHLYAPQWWRDRDLETP